MNTVTLNKRGMTCTGADLFFPVFMNSGNGDIKLLSTFFDYLIKGFSNSVFIWAVYRYRCQKQNFAGNEF
jgi:hypothetical protein